MGLRLASYPNPFDANNPLSGAFTWIGGLAIDFSAGSGRITLLIHPNAAASYGRPIDTLGVSLGQEVGQGVRFPTLAELMDDPEFAAAFTAIEAKLYGALVSSVPALAGATFESA